MAKYTDGTQAEKVLDLNITVLDVNDCVPVIQIGQVGQVSEASAPGILRSTQYFFDKAYKTYCFN